MCLPGKSPGDVEVTGEGVKPRNFDLSSNLLSEDLAHLIVTGMCPEQPLETGTFVVP